MALVSPIDATTWDHSEHIDRFVGYGLLQDGSAVVRPLAVLGLFSRTYWLDPEDAVKYAAALGRRAKDSGRWGHVGMLLLAMLLLWFYLAAELALLASVGIFLGAGWHVRRLVLDWFLRSFPSALPMTDPHLWQRLEMASVTSPYLVLPRVLWLSVMAVSLAFAVLPLLANWSPVAGLAAGALLLPCGVYTIWLLALHSLFRWRNGRAPRPHDAAAFHRQLGYLEVPYEEVV